jgi:hypothetical protein
MKLDLLLENDHADYDPEDASTDLKLFIKYMQKHNFEKTVIYDPVKRPGVHPAVYFNYNDWQIWKIARGEVVLNVIIYCEPNKNTWTIFASVLDEDNGEVFDNKERHGFSSFKARDLDVKQVLQAIDKVLKLVPTMVKELDAKQAEFEKANRA